MMRINHPAGLIGDSVNALPALYDLANRVDLRVYFGNQAVAALVTHPCIEVAHEPLPCPDATLDIAMILGRIGWRQHMIEAYYLNLGMNLQPASLPFFYPDIAFRPVDDAHDTILVAPHSRSDQGHNKKWFDERWGAVFSRFPKIGFEILGTNAADGRPWSLPNVRYCYDLPLGDVAYKVRRAPLTITIDTGISHIAHIVGGNHTLLHGLSVPAVAINNRRPNAQNIGYRPESYAPADLIAALQSGPFAHLFAGQ